MFEIFKKKKVFCRECELYEEYHGDETDIGTSITCKAEYDESLSFVGWLVMYDPIIKNRSNDCKDFKRK
jgi:hypothetical protein